ncbi:MAG TPA: hypothetical protein PLU30_19340 [Verrucomicrobiae bacterium]|nr:hypothetical protein [Verrucomicrobiae bacterium]
MSLDLRGVVGAALVTGSFGLAAVSSTAASAATFPRHVEMGPPETVLAHGRFGLTYFPDERLTVVRDRPSYRALIAAGVSSYLLEGPGPTHGASSSRAISPSPASVGATRPS